MKINTCKPFLWFPDLYTGFGFQGAFVIPNELIES